VVMRVYLRRVSVDGLGAGARDRLRDLLDRHRVPP
jgi:hypothetical protein